VWLSVIWVVGRFWGGCWNFFLVADCWCHEGSGVADLSLVLREFFLVADCCFGVDLGLLGLGLVAVWVAVWP
jgi:hypothetical protein